MQFVIIHETFLIPIETKEVLAIIQNVKEESASGFDGIYFKILKVIQNHIVESLRLFSTPV